MPQKKKTNKTLSPKDKVQEVDVTTNADSENSTTRGKREIKDGTTTAYAKRVYDAIRTGKIDMGASEDKSVPNVTRAEHWRSRPLITGAIVEFTRTLKLTDRDDGKRHKARNIITIHHSGRKHTVSGEWARKTYIALTRISRKKTVDMSRDDIEFCDSALGEL